MSNSHLGAMVDIETLSTRPNAVIVSIGACKYDLETSKTYDDFYVNIDPRDSKKYGLHIDPNTIEWWKKQDSNVFKQWQNGIPLLEAMTKFLNYYDKNLAFTSWGLDFDSSIISSSLYSLNMTPPWIYYKSRCARTIAEIEGIKIQRSKNHHNALQDCKDQCNVLFKIFGDNK